MIDIRASSEDEMVCAFLNMEYRSERFRDEIAQGLETLGLDESLICDGSDRTGGPAPVWRAATPDFADTEKNEQRRRLLAAYRGYPDHDLFENYPTDIRWKLVRLEKGDIDKLRYVDYCYWNDLSQGTSRPVDGAASVKAGITSCDVPNDGFWKGLNALISGTEFPPMILLTADEEKYLILEGHLRATVYGMKEGSEDGTTAYVGVCDRGALSRKNAGF